MTAYLSRSAFNYIFAFANKMVPLDQIVKSNKKCAVAIESLQSKLAELQREILGRKKAQLKCENATLQEQINLAKADLIEWEVRNGKNIVPLPVMRQVRSEANNLKEHVQAVNKNIEPKTYGDSNKRTKETKVTKEKPDKKGIENNVVEELPIDIRRLDLRVGRIIDISRHPDADSLYVEKIDCGEQKLRTVVSGLVKYVPLEEMQNLLVVVLCNLKPAKMRGITSEAMVMCASSPDKVEVLNPPPGAEPGDLIHCEGYPRVPDALLNPKKKIFETCALHLNTNDTLIACFKNAPLHIPCKGPIVAQTLKNVPVK